MCRTVLQVRKCFLCEMMEPMSEQRQAMAMQLNDRLNECARNLNDGKLLAILSSGDVVAKELKYHCSCLAALHNRERAYQLAKNKDTNGVNLGKEELPLVFSELLTYVTETRNNSDEPVVFRPTEMVRLYKQRLQQFVTTVLTVVNSTRLKDNLLA